MAKIVTIDKQTKEDEDKKKPFSIENYRNSFSSMDSFSKILGVTFVLLIVAAPIMLYGRLNSTTHAAPDFTITNPVDKSIILPGSTIILNLQTQTPTQVSKVEFYVNGVLQCSVSTDPYICSWNVPLDKNTQYIIETRLYDTQGTMFPKTETVTSGNL